MSLPIAPSVASSGPVVEPPASAARKRRREEPQVNTYEGFDSAFRDAIQSGIDVSNCEDIFKDLFAHAQQIEVPAEKDQAFAEMADYLCNRIGLKHDRVYALWCRAALAATKSKTTDYFVNSLLRGSRALSAFNPDGANTWIRQALGYLKKSDCTPAIQIAGCTRIIDACEDNEKLAKVSRSALQHITDLQGAPAVREMRLARAVLFPE